MKAFLMYPDRDLDLEQPLPQNEQDLTQDLELDILFQSMALGDKFIYDVVRSVILTGAADPDIIRYRQAILQDCLANAAIVRSIYQISIRAIANKKKIWGGIFSRVPSGILSEALQLLQVYWDLLKELRSITDQHGEQFKSTGFTRFFAMIREELSDEYLESVQAHLNELKFRDGVLISASLGTGNEGKDYVLRKPNTLNQSWVERVFSKKPPVYSFRLHPRDDHGARAVGELKSRGINLAANALAQSSDHINSFLNMVRIELAFYIGCIHLSEKLAELDEPFAYPVVTEAPERHYTARGLFDISLALTMNRKIVGNDLDADGKDLVMITGANQGGKSTFLRSIGLAQLMMQCGMYVPAEVFRASMWQGLFTHYKREEDTTMESGKLDEELGRMSQLVNDLRPHSLILFNESFAATNEREGSEIARQIVSALLDKGIRVFFVTHLYELAHHFCTRRMDNSLFLRAERQEDGARTFKVREGKPLQTSYGTDLYRQIFSAEN